MTPQVPHLTREALTIQPSAVAAIPRGVFTDLLQAIKSGRLVVIDGTEICGCGASDRFDRTRQLVGVEEDALIEALKAAAEDSTR